MRKIFIFLLLSFFIPSLVSANGQNIDVKILKDEKKLIKKLLKKDTNIQISNRLLSLYYKGFKYKTFFVNTQDIKPLAFKLLNTIENDEVLKPNMDKFFNLKKINNHIKKIQTNPTKEDLIKLDFLFISIYHKYMTLLSKGTINWKKFKEYLENNEDINTNWEKYNARKNIRKLLYKAINKDNINFAIDQVNYTYPKAKELEKKIKEYELLAKNGGYIKIPKIKKSIKKENYSTQVKLIRERLLQSGYIKANDCNMDKEEFIFPHQEQEQVEVKIDANTASININNSENICDNYYDGELFKAVKMFQKDNGLTQDGIIGKNTIKALNIPIEEKIKKMRLNLERMRWLPRNLGKRFIVVNIPAFDMKMYFNNEKKIQMRVIVGNKKHPTPIFSHRMSEIILNPYWRIPQSIVKKELIPNLVKNQNYLEEEDINIHENWDYKSVKYDPNGIDWSIFLDNNLIGDDKNAPMRFIQIPGDKNPLGKMKFLFPNKYSVYLHDTPAKYLFKKDYRAFSHGCIRLSNPKELLNAISKEEDKIDLKNSEEILKTKQRTDIDLDKKIPVHIVYLTAWVDENNKVQFRDDIYGYDEIQGKILFNKD